MKKAKLSDRDRAEICAAYVQGGVSYQALGDKYGVCGKTIERIVKADSHGLSDKVEEIKQCC